MQSSSSPLAGLSAETAAMRALLDLLGREQSCLAAGDTDGCAVLWEEKATQISMLSALATQRHRQLAVLGFAADEHGMIDWLRTSTTDARAAWDALTAVTRDAHEYNRLNGLLLAQLAARNRQALEALGLRASGSGLYGPGGQSDYGAPRAAHFIG